MHLACDFAAHVRCAAKVYNIFGLLPHKKRSSSLLSQSSNEEESIIPETKKQELCPQRHYNYTTCRIDDGSEPSLIQWLMVDLCDGSADDSKDVVKQDLLPPHESQLQAILSHALQAPSTLPHAPNSVLSCSSKHSLIELPDDKPPMISLATDVVRDRTFSNSINSPFKVCRRGSLKDILSNLVVTDNSTQAKDRI